MEILRQGCLDKCFTEAELSGRRGKEVKEAGQKQNKNKKQCVPPGVVLVSSLICMRLWRRNYKPVFPLTGRDFHPFTSQT